MKVHAMRIPVLAVAIAVLLSILAVTVGQIGAQQGSDASGSGLSISPTRTELKINRGESDTVELNIRNVTRGAIVAKPFVSDFESDDATGEPRLTDKRNSASINSFVSGLADVPLAPGENKNVKYTINIPDNAVAGAYYGALTFRAVPANQSDSDAGGQVALTANVASLVLIEVPGDISEQIQVNSVKALRKNKASSFFTIKPDQAAISIRNNGNSFSKPFGSVIVTDLSGKQVYSYELNNSTPRSNILPKTSRTFTDGLKNVNKPGRYTITANISHGTGGEVLTSKATFWYVPVWLILTILVLAVALGAGGYLLYRKQAGRKKK